METKNKAKCSRDSIFIKILDKDFFKKLIMSSAFTQHFNGEVPGWLLLEIAGSRRWRVTVENDATGTLYFTNGWDVFVEANGLDVGDVLLFEFQKPHIFDVTIFDKDGIEKTMSQIAESKAYRNKDCGHQYRTSLKPHAEASRFSSRTDKSTLPDKDGFEKPVDQTLEFDTYENEDSEHYHETLNTHHADDSADNARQVVDAFERKATRVSISKNGLAFSITWRNSKHLYYYLVKKNVPISELLPIQVVSVQFGWGNNYFPRKCKHFDSLRHYLMGKLFSLQPKLALYLASYVLSWVELILNKVEMQTIPKAVATNMNLSNQEKVILKDQEDNSWLIELRVRPGRVDLAQGWRKFLYDKKITVGDMLTFEFLSKNLIQVMVECPAQAHHPSHSVFNVAFKHVEPAINYDGKHQKPQASKNAESECSKFRRSSFKITWRETTHAEFLIIPNSVAGEQKLVNNQSIVLSGEGGKLWHMPVKIKPIVGCFYLSRGWPEFWQGNGIATGDTLNFDFVSVGMAKVSITRASQTHGHSPYC